MFFLVVVCERATEVAKGILINQEAGPVHVEEATALGRKKTASLDGLAHHLNVHMPQTPFPGGPRTRTRTRPIETACVASSLLPVLFPLRRAVGVWHVGRRCLPLAVGEGVEGVAVLLLFLFLAGEGGVEELLLGELALVIVAAVVLDDLEEDVAVRDAQDIVQPEDVQRLQAGQQTKRDALRDPALVLLRCPVQLVRAHGDELVEHGVQDAEVEVVPHVAPHEDEEGEVRPHQGVVHVVEGLGALWG